MTVLTCIGCGAMGRQERCEGACAEHKLVLVSAGDYEALLTAAQAARAGAARLAAMAARLADGDAEQLPSLRAAARDALRDCPAGAGWSDPATVTGWWCDRCGNVDMPQPCIGVCVWRPADWVNVAVYEEQRRLAEPSLRAERSLRRLLAHVAAVRPRPGQERRNWEALQAQARVALADHRPDAPAPAAPEGARPLPRADEVVRVHLWPR